MWKQVPMFKTFRIVFPQTAHPIQQLSYNFSPVLSVLIHNRYLTVWQKSWPAFQMFIHSLHLSVWQSWHLTTPSLAGRSTKWRYQLIHFWSGWHSTPPQQGLKKNRSELWLNRNLWSPDKNDHNPSKSCTIKRTTQQDVQQSKTTVLPTFSSRQDNQHIKLWPKPPNTAAEAKPAW